MKERNQAAGSLFPRYRQFGMTFARRYSSLALLALFLHGCASTGNIPLVGEQAARVDRAEVIVGAGSGVVATSGPVKINGFKTSKDFSGSKLELGQIVSAKIGVAIANALLVGIIANSYEDRTQENEQLIATKGQVFFTSYAFDALQRGLAEMKQRQLDINIEGISVTESGVADSKLSTPRADSMAKVQMTLDQGLSQDLSRLRLRLEVVARTASGETLMRQRYLYLPPSLEGETREQTMDAWNKDEGAIYKSHIDSGVRSLLAAVDATLFSHRSAGSTSLSGAPPTTLHTHCFGGDFDVGIPLNAYRSGTVIAQTPEYTVVRLENSDIISFPACAG